MSRQDLAVNGGEPVRSSPYPAWPKLGPGDLDRVRGVLETSQWGGSEVVEAFEELFALYHDCSYGIAVTSGTMALELALQALGIGPGQEVIVPAHSFVATALAVSRVGATPVFVDIERDSFNINPTQVAEAVTDQSRALIPVHFGGVAADMDRLSGVAEERGLEVIEDAAHAHGAEWFGSRTGGLGTCGIFSFQNSKAMTAGEGGILVTGNETLAAKARSIANAGRIPGQGWFEHFEVGTNLRMTSVQAALLNAQLERLQEQIRLRAANFARFHGGLDGVDGVELQQAPEGATVQTRYIVPGHIDAKRFGIERDEFVRALQAEGIPVRPFYPHPLYANPVFRTLPHRTLHCPVAEQATRDAFWLPLSVFMGTAEDAEDAARAITKLHQACRPRRRGQANGSAAG